MALTLVTAAAMAFAAFIAVDTLRAVVPLWSPLPWFDEWATVSLVGAWQEGDMTAAQVLFSQHNEHRILVPRLAFFADDLLFRGEGHLTLALIFAVQVLHAALFAAVLGRAGPARRGRWAVAAAVLALMFSLRQGENFSSGFQLQFVAVFAGATSSFVLFALAARRARAGAAPTAALLASLLAALLTTFTMANGLLVGYVLAILALAARMRLRVVLACAAWAALLTAVYLHGYEPVEHHSQPSDSFRHPIALLGYVATYLGSVAATDRTGPATILGLAGLAATACAALRVFRRGGPPAALAMLGVMLFVCATAAVTAAGRLDFGIGQALSSRYVSGAVAFWSAQLTYWWIDSPGGLGRPASRRGAAARAAVGALAAVLCFAVGREQQGAKAALAAQSFAQNESANLLMLGLDDPAAIRRAAWTDEDVQRLLPVLKEHRWSVFATGDAAGVGRPVTERGTLGAPCEGAVEAAVADPALGPGGVRVSGRAADGPRRRLVRRVLLTDDSGRVTGLASGAVPGAARDAWRGFASAPVGAVLTAYGLVDGDRLCRVGRAAVAPAQASQPDAAP